MENLDYIEKLVQNDFSLLAETLNLPLVYYSHKHNVTLKYEKEQTFEPEPFHTRGDSAGLKRAKITLFGKNEVDIENLKWLIKDEAKKHQKIYDLKTL